MSTIINSGMVQAAAQSTATRNSLMNGLAAKLSPEEIQIRSLLNQEANANMNAAANSVKSALQTTQAVSRN
jgi:hypothetical protein